MAQLFNLRSVTVQQSLFNQDHNILPYNGEVYYYPNFFTKAESDEIFQDLKLSMDWEQRPIKIFGKEVMQPRLTAWYGDKGVNYGYSGISMVAKPWTKALLKIKQRLEDESTLEFNSALLNLYRDGNDSMGWHRDNEKELGLNPIIASITFGSLRKFQMRSYYKKSGLITIPLEHGSLLLMKGETQVNWEHRVAKTKLKVGERINLTFRSINELF